jgi:hypothetical protein
VGDWTEKRKTVMLLSNGKRIIIIKVKTDKVSKNKKKTPVVPAGMTSNRLHNVNVRESKHLVRSPGRGSAPRPPAD